MIAKTHKPKHYVDNKTLYETLIKFKNSKKEALALGTKPPRIPEYVGVCIFQIATRLATKGNFINYSYKDEMISDGIENCIQYFRNFDPTKSKNPFAYFTQIIYFAFLRRIAKEKKQLYVKYKATQQFGLLNEGEMYEDEHGNMKQFEMYDNIAEFIETFEATKENKKKAKIKGLEKFIEEDITLIEDTDIIHDEDDINK
jgi:hypothetical protein